MKLKMLLLGIILLLGSCAYHSQITFSEDGRSATLKGNVKSEAEIDVANKKAKINQIGETWLQKLQKVIPQNVEVAK